jgi:hypothetical protein
MPDTRYTAYLSDFTDEDKTATLVLIREAGSEAHGVQERTWAYVVNDRLPEYFSDAAGTPMHKVPKRFHNELASYTHNHKRHPEA